MASSIRDPDVLARTVTVYGGPAGHRVACGFTGDGAEVEAVVASPTGTVTFHASGPPGPGARAAPAAALGGDGAGARLG